MTTANKAQPRQPIRLVMADDHRMVLTALRHLLSVNGDCEILAQAQDVAALLALPELPLADVVLLDLNLPVPAGESYTAELPGLKALPRLRQLTHAKIVVLSMHDESAVVLRALHLGANAFVTKSSTGDRLFEALETVMQGNSYVDPAIMGMDGVRAAAPVPFPEPRKEVAGGVLSRQEREVANLLLAGMTQKAISNRLGVSPQTTHTYKRRLKEKLDVTTDVELLRKLPAVLAEP
ncbi:MAG: response regulator transcription factor [Burkholderiaceae bacterium]|nr:response regulator transcription factor [Burkholderiaceae bacterium]